MFEQHDKRLTDAETKRRVVELNISSSPVLLVTRVRVRTAGEISMSLKKEEPKRTERQEPLCWVDKETNKIKAVLRCEHQNGQTAH